MKGLPQSKDDEACEIMLRPCRRALLDCVAAATEVAVLFMFASDERTVEHAKDALLSARACSVLLKSLVDTRASEARAQLHEVRLVGRLCYRLSQDEPSGLPLPSTIVAWRAACAAAAVSCRLTAVFLEAAGAKRGVH